MIKIRSVTIADIDSIVNLVSLNADVLRPNNKMIYYLCCTIFRKYSFLAVDENTPLGFLFAFKDSEKQCIWIHQFAVDPDKQTRGIGTKLLRKLESEIKENETSPNFIKLAVKPDNYKAKEFYLNHEFKFLKLEECINMEIFEKQIISPDSLKLL